MPKRDTRPEPIRIRHIVAVVVAVVDGAISIDIVGIAIAATILVRRHYKPDPI